MKKRQSLLAILAISLLLGCSMGTNRQKAFSLQGAWSLSQVEYPIGQTDTFPDAGPTYLRIYEGDSVMMQCQLTKTASAIVIKPQGRCNVTLIDKGGGERLYLEDDDPCPLTVKDDTTIIIQQNGILYTWHRTNGIDKEWAKEIRGIFSNAAAEGDMVGMNHYVLSEKEREQASFIHWMFFAFAILALVFLQVILANQRARRRLQLQLSQIKEEHERRPQPVRKAIKTVEEAYFASDEYQLLQRRLSNGQRMREEEWKDVEEQVHKVYPGFCSQLRNLYAMSELEYQVCLLIKLRIVPSNIASVLSRDVSTISTVRSRLYKKVFGQKGGAREWDDFVLSIGA